MKGVWRPLTNEKISRAGYRELALKLFDAKVPEFVPTRISDCTRYLNLATLLICHRYQFQLICINFPLPSGLRAPPPWNPFGPPLTYWPIGAWSNRPIHLCGT